ncbi:hypothetical protein MP638_003896 [Amoeboaphelidium occidentale]|nr:hypothetical protein MP638_003896 [Amoeboaphelidium occidentale]
MMLRSGVQRLFGARAKALSQLPYAKPCLLVQSRFATKIVKVPSLADSITEGELARWEKKVGEFVKQDEHVATIETDKVDVQVNSPESGVILKVFSNEGDSVEVGSDFFEIDLDGKPGAAAAASAAKPEQKSAPPKAAETAPKAEPKKETPKANDAGLKPPPTTPPAGKSIPTPAPKKEASSAPATQKPVVYQDGVVPGLVPLPAEFRVERVVKMNRMRQRIAERLKESQNKAASLTTFNEVDMSNIMEFRNKYKDEILKEHGIKLGFMSAFVKASTAALKIVPAVNASIDDSDPENPVTVFHDYVDVSVAVATPKGLVTPVIRNAERLSFLEVEKAVAEYGKKARDNKIAIEDMAGGTFTISNGGVFGSLYGTPIINVPQSGILGMHAVKDRPVVVNGKIEIRPMMYIALTYDHRIIDGREAVTFLKTVKEFVEDPRRLLLQ